MSEYCVVVAAGSCARFFTLKPSEIPEIESSPRLVELKELRQREMHERDMWSEAKSGRNRAASGGTHGYDDHREQHEEEHERRFAREIAQNTAKLVKNHGATRVIIVAQKRLLGFLRDSAGAVLKTGVEIQELAKDLSKFSSRELHEHLAKLKLLPACKAPTAL